MEPSDADVMRCVQAGDLTAFEILVRRYRSALMRVAVSKLADRSVADDVVQEAFLAAFSARVTFNPRFAFRTWLWTILLRLCQRQWQRQQTMNYIGGLIDPQEADANSGTDFSALEAAIVTETNQHLEASMRQLPDAEADALRLRFFGQLPYDEIAQAMGSSVNGAKLRVKNGLLRLSVLCRDLKEIDQ